MSTSVGVLGLPLGMELLQLGGLVCCEKGFDGGLLFLFVIGTLLDLRDLGFLGSGEIELGDEDGMILSCRGYRSSGRRGSGGCGWGAGFRSGGGLGTNQARTDGDGEAEEEQVFLHIRRQTA